MFILLTETPATEGTLKFAVTIIIAILVGLGAGFRTFQILRNKKMNTSSLETLVNSIYKDQVLIDLLKSSIDSDYFKKSNTYEEFISNVYEAAEAKIFVYLQGNSSFIPEKLKSLVTKDNMKYITESILGLLGFDGKKLVDMFEEYLANELTKDYEEDKEPAEEIINEQLSFVNNFTYEVIEEAIPVIPEEQLSEEIIEEVDDAEAWDKVEVEEIIEEEIKE